MSTGWLAEKLDSAPGAGAGGGFPQVSWIHMGKMGFGAESVRSVASQNVLDGCQTSICLRVPGECREISDLRSDKVPGNLR